MDTAHDQIAKEISAVFEKIFTAGNFSDEQRAQLFGSLEEAVVLHSINELFRTVTPEEKAQTLEQKFGSQEDLLSYLEAFVSKGHFSRIIAASIAHVISTFFGGLLSKTQHQS